MRSHLFCWLVFSGCFVPGLCRAADSIIDSAVLDRLRDIATKDWQSVGEEFRVFDVTFKNRYSQGPPNQLKLVSNQTYRFAYNLDRGLCLLRGQNEAFPGHMVHDVSNPGYVFQVNNTDMTARGTLNRLNVHIGTKTAMPTKLPDWQGDRCKLMSACRMACMSLRELLDPTQFKVVEAVDFMERGEPLVRLRARYLGEKGVGKRKNGNYTVVLDPVHRYRLISWEIEVPKKSKQTFQVFYHSGDHSFFPKEIVNIDDSNGQRTEDLWTYGLPQPWALPDAEFYLPHYGISESILETLNPNPWPRWLLIGFGVLTIAIGAWLVRGRRQPAA